VVYQPLMDIDYMLMMEHCLKADDGHIADVQGGVYDAT
jgi:hypothetical protein